MVFEQGRSKNDVVHTWPDNEQYASLQRGCCSKKLHCRHIQFRLESPDRDLLQAARHNGNYGDHDAKNGRAKSHILNRSAINNLLM